MEHRSGTLAPEAKAKILKDRAKALARRPKSADAEEDFLQVVEFVVADERYAVESARIREVYRMKELTPLPCTPPFVLGIINVRGQIVSVIDIKKFFGLPEKGLTDLNKVIIVRSGDMEVGLLADAIVGSRRIPTAGIHPPLPTLTGIGADYLTGVTGEGLVVLDVGRILSDEAIIVHEEVTA